jgi:hypothetical protein
MNKFLTLLCTASLASAAAAADPGPVLDAGAVKPVPQEIDGVCLPPTGPCCGKRCPDKICVPELRTDKTQRVYYECETKDYCLARCPFPFCRACKKGCKDCGPGPCPKCSKLRVRNVLIKKSATEEEQNWTCVPKSLADMPCPE